MAFVPEPESNEAARSRVRVGDVLVGITGANTGWVGFVEQAQDGGYVSQHVGLLRPRGLHPRWLAYSMFSPSSRDQLLGEQYGGTKQQLSLDELAELIIRVPPREQQEELISRLDQQVATVDRLRAKLQHQIELLTEHRQALITAAVTGGLEVAGA
ncbi:MAG: restriction endonuclease subunit S [Rubrobacter sp.]|nr:restriction endonuclease subunit S [Rubrobacter sp.]